ncbi:MAG: GDP-mannose 4,6-dehydratase [Actinobacteria bacterium]|nr:GDP-mannose 4,6-dehydratase [Actinomycetota bacterium]
MNKTITTDKILITGATGFIGLHLAKKLMEEGEKIKCLVRKSSSRTAIDFLNSLDAELAYGDLLDKESLKEALKDTDTIFHLGGGGRVGMLEEICYKINVEGTKNLLDICVEQGHLKNFIHVSTCAVMGDIKNGPADETYPYNPSNIIYSKAKTESEKIALSYGDKIKLAVVRFPGVYGIPLIKEDINYMQGVTPALMIFFAVKNGQWMYIGDGKNLIHMFNVEDAVNGLILVSKNRKPGEIYIIGDDKSYSMHEFIELIAKILGVNAPKRYLSVSLARFFATLFELKVRFFGGSPRMSKEMINGFISNMSFSIAKSKFEIGYGPTIKLEDGLRETVKWYKENNFL